MNKVANFEKVSYEQYKKDLFNMGMYSEADEERIMREWESIKLPDRATTGSAGYDFYMPIDCETSSGVWTTIPTGIRCKMNKGQMLMCCPKSGLGFKYRMELANTIGIVDAKGMMH